jgi:replicative DNA helicase
MSGKGASQGLERPNAVASERAVLGAIMARPSTYAEVAQLLRTADFYTPAHAVLYEALRGVIEAGLTPDLVTLAEELKALGGFDVVGGMSVVAMIGSELPDVGNVRWYAERVAEAGRRRRIQDLGLALTRDAATKPVAQVLDDATRVMGDLLAPWDEGSGLIADLCAAEVLAARERAAGTREERVIHTGIERLDGLLGGIRPGQLVLVAARPGVGKTSLAMQVSAHAAITQGRRVLFVSLEMSREELAARLLAQRAGISVHRIKAGKLDYGRWSGDGGEWPTLDAAVAAMRGAAFEVVDRGCETVGKLGAQCRARMVRGGVDLVVVDYLQLLESGKRHGNRTEEVGAISRGLKVLASDLRVPILAASQLTREPDRRAESRGHADSGRVPGEPRLSDLRESGSLENDANAVLLLHRKPEGTPYEKATALAILAKNRSGPTGRLPLRYDERTLTFAAAKEVEHE